MIECDPELAAAFKNSTMVSSKFICYSLLPSPNFIVCIYIASKGSGAAMLKIGSKRRRTKNEIAGEKVM